MRVYSTIATGKLPDLIARQGISESSMINEGAIVPITPYLDLAPNYVAAIGADKAGITNANDGQIYAISSIIDIPPAYQMAIRKDWLERVGLDVPETWEEWLTVWRAFRDQDANGNGDPNDEIPFTGIGLGMDFLSPFGMTDVYGQRYLVNDDGTVRYAYTSEEYKEGIKWAHKLYQDGLIDNELFTQNDQIRDAKCDDPNVSRVGFCYAWSYDAIFRNWKDEYKVIAPIAGPDGQRYQQGDLNGLYSLKSNQLSITTVCKHPEVVLALGGSVLHRRSQHPELLGRPGRSDHRQRGRHLHPEQPAGGHQRRRVVLGSLPARLRPQVLLRRV